MEKKMKGQLFTFCGETFKVTDDPDYGHVLEANEYREKVFDQKTQGISRAEYLAGILPLLIRILIPDAEKSFTFSFKDRKYLFKSKRLGMVAVENLLTDLEQIELDIVREKLPTLYEAIITASKKKAEPTVSLELSTGDPGEAIDLNKETLNNQQDKKAMEKNG